MSKPHPFRYFRTSRERQCQRDEIAIDFVAPYPARMSKPNPFRYFRTSREFIRLPVMLYVRLFPLSLLNVEDLLYERGIDVSHDSVRCWWMRFGPFFASEIRKARAQRMRCHWNWKWHLDEVFAKINGETHYMWRAVDHEGVILKAFVTKRRDRKAEMKFLKKLMKRYGQPEKIVTDNLRSYGAAMKDIGNADRQNTGRWLNNRIENSHLPFRRRERAMSASGAGEVCRNSPPSILQSTTFSIRSAASTADKISSATAPLLSPSGANSARHKGQLHCPS